MLKMAERVIRRGGRPRGEVAADVGPEDARALLEAWLDGVGLELRGRELIAYLQADELLPRRPLPARPPHPRPAACARRSTAAPAAVAGGDFPAPSAASSRRWCPASPTRRRPPSSAPRRRSCATAAASGRGSRVIADGIGSMHGVTHTIEQIRERGVPGFEVDVVGTDPGVDRRLPAAAELEIPFYEGMTLGVPGLPDLVETLAEGSLRPRPRHRPRPGRDRRHADQPDHRRAAARQLPHRARRLRRHAQRRRRPRGADPDGARRLLLGPGGGPLAEPLRRRLGCSPSAPTRPGSAAGSAASTSTRFDPAKADRDAFPGEIKVLYAGRLTREKGVDLLAESFLRAHAADPRLHLLLAGGGPEEDELRERLGERATFLGWLAGEELPRAYASADVFLFC